MSKVLITRSKLDSLADAIGSKSSQGIPLTIDQMRDAVLDIEIGITPSGTKNITKNGTYDVTEYASTKVNIQPKLQAKSVHPSTESQTIIPDSGYNGLSNVNVEAMMLGTTTVTPTTEAQVVMADSGYDALNSVTVEATPLYNTTVTPSTETQILSGSTRLPSTLVGTLVYSNNGVYYTAINNRGIQTPNSSSVAQFPWNNVYHVSGEVTVTNLDTNGTRKFIFNGDLPTSMSIDSLVSEISDTGDISGLGSLSISSFPVVVNKKSEIRLETNNEWSPSATFSFNINLAVHEFEDYIGLSQVTVNPIPSEYIVPTGELGITENGIVDVTQYASVNVSVPIGGNTYQDESGYIILDEKGNGSSPSVTVDALSVTANGTYTAPTGHAYSPITVNVSAGDSPYTLLDSSEFSVSTTSTSASLVGTIKFGDALYTADAIIYVKVRDKAGKRNGFFYGTDTFFINPYAAKGTSQSVIAIRPSILYSYDENGLTKFNPTSSGYVTTSNTSSYGVYAYAITDAGAINIYSRYSSSNTGTIDGTYTVDTYLLKWPDDISPITSIKVTS